MNPCNSLIPFSGSIHDHSVTNFTLTQVKKNVRLKDQKGKKCNCWTAANTSHSNCTKKEFFN